MEFNSCGYKALCHHLMECYCCLDQRGAGPENRWAERLLLEMEVEDLTIDGRQGIRRWKVECKHREMPLESNST